MMVSEGVSVGAVMVDVEGVSAGGADFRLKLAKSSCSKDSSSNACACS